MHLRLRCLVLVLAWCFTAFSKLTSAPTESPRELFLLIGQSNMAGRGVVEDQDKVPHPRIFMLNASKAWVPAVDPLHFDKPKMAGVGLGSSFARTVAAAEPTAIIGLIPAAVGGTSLDQWVPDGELYTQAVERAKAALSQGGRLRAILWHQGESDSQPDKAATYAARFNRLISRLRTDLGYPAAPVIVGELSHARSTSGVLNPVLRNLPNSVARCTCVASDGLTDKGDGTHFDSPSLREFGRRYARAFLSMPATASAASTTP
ncbi:MAG TPA: sialate O-acetylesterase [Opitutaceae bacterium]|nr:sialate O-acetylesterase [Opitutaceae bacterium]